MSKMQPLLVSAALAIGIAAPAWAATTDPEVIIYRFPGVIDDGGFPNNGVATMFNCTNFSGATESLRLVTRDGNGTLLKNLSQPIAHLVTQALSTHDTVFSEITMNTGSVTHGTTAIAATSTNIVCTAMILDAANPKPVGVALRGIRFNPAPGSQE